MDLLRQIRHRPEPVNRDALREEMTRNDPDFARVRDVQHDALGVLTGKRLGEGIRREREFWERSGK